MKQLCLLLALMAFQFFSPSGTARAAKLIPPNNPNIQYFGRWDMADSLHPRYSWPGVYIVAEFSGTTIGIRIADGTDYFNVYIDGKLHGVFHGTNPAETDYVLADSLPNTHHTFLLSRRNITFEKPYTFCGIILYNDAALFPPPPKPSRKIEFIGDSFTAGESDEATVQQLEWEARFPVTNIDKGFAPLIAKTLQRAIYDNLPLGRRNVLRLAGKHRWNHTKKVRPYADGNERTQMGFQTMGSRRGRGLPRLE